MRIENIKIRNYRLFRRAKLRNLPELTILVGANGSGKSTLFDVFAFLKDALTRNVATAVTRRGGFRELVSRGSEGPISITVQFRESGGRLATYVLEVATRNGRVVVGREVLRYGRGRYGKPWHFVDFSGGEGYAITNESVYGQEGVREAHEEFKLDDPSVLAIKGLGQFQRFRVVSEFRSLIENWRISDFHISDARPSVEAGYAEHPSTRGDNVAQVAQYLYQHHPECFDRVLRAMSSRVPGVSRVEARPTEDGRLVLRFPALNGHAATSLSHAPHTVTPVPFQSRRSRHTRSASSSVMLPSRSSRRRSSVTRFPSDPGERSGAVRRIGSGYQRPARPESLPFLSLGTSGVHLSECPPRARCDRRVGHPLGQALHSIMALRAIVSSLPLTHTPNACRSVPPSSRA